VSSRLRRRRHRRDQLVGARVRSSGRVLRATEARQQKGSTTPAFTAVGFFPAPRAPPNSGSARRQSERGIQREPRRGEGGLCARLPALRGKARLGADSSTKPAPLTSPSKKRDRSSVRDARAHTHRSAAPHTHVQRQTAPKTPFKEERARRESPPRKRTPPPFRRTCLFPARRRRPSPPRSASFLPPGLLPSPRRQPPQTPLFLGQKSKGKTRLHEGSHSFRFLQPPKSRLVRLSAPLCLF
jgi:hypothetical protein